MGKTITLVSAFFDIGRGNITDTALVRGVDKYFKYFADWCRMKNKLVVYTEPRFVDEVMKVRAQYGLEDLTTVIPVEDIYAIAPDIYERMKAVSENERFCNYRYLNHAMSNKANYDYVMLLKYWCLMDAVKQGYVDGTVAWIDFGFNHSSEIFTNPEEFDYVWEYEFEDKIHLFALQDPDKELGIRNLQLQTDCIMGCLLVLPDKYCEKLWELMVDAMKALLMLDSIDDDQQLLLMAYRSAPEIFKISISTWFIPLKEYGGPHLSAKNPPVPPTLTAVGKVKHAIKRVLRMTREDEFLERIRKEMVK